MAVHFMFAASKQLNSVPVVGDSITLGKLKDEIYNLKFRAACEKRKTKEAFDFRVYDAETKEEIFGAQSRVPKHSRVVVKRVPAYVISELEKKKLTAQSCRKEELKEPFKPRENAFDDGFGDDIFSTSSCEKSSSGDSTTSSLTAIKSLEVQKIDEVSVSKIVMPKVVQRRRVEKLVKNLNVNLQSVAKSSPESAKVFSKVEIPLELTCSLCHEIMKDPVLIPCCCNSFCRNCVTIAILEHQKCPNCGSSKCKDSDLLPNRNTNDRILSFLKSSGIASNVVTVSSNGSCSSQSLNTSSISSEQDMSESKKTLNDKPSVSSHVTSYVASHVASQMAPCSNVSEKRKAPLCISLISAKKPKMVVAAMASAS